MQFTIKDKTFDSGRLNAFQQLHVVRRLAPVTERLAQGYHFNVKPWQEVRTEKTAQDIIGRVRTASL